MFWRKKKVKQVRQEPKASEYSTDSISSLAFQAQEEEIDTNEFLKQWNLENAIQHQPKMPEGVAMDSCDASNNAYDLNFNRVNQSVLSYYIMSSSFIGYQAMGIIGQHWLVAKGCYQKGRDALRRGYDITRNDGEELSTEDSKLIIAADKKYKVKKNMIRGVGMNNMFGIRHIMFKNTDKNFDYSKPFNPDAFKNGKYAGISQIDPYWISPWLEAEDLNDPTSINFYDPEFWQVQGKKIHKSHMVILIGEEVSDILKPSYRYGGVSIAQKVYERVYAAERTANEAPQLTMTKRLNVRKVDLEKAQANKARFINNLKAANEYRDNYGQMVIGTGEELHQLETSLSDLDSVITSQYEIVCSIFDIPASKLLGTGHNGFSTGETDEDYYISSLETLQGTDLEDIANAHYQRLIPSLFNESFDVEVVWKPLKVMSDKDLAEVNNLNSQTAVNEANIGAIDAVDERNRLIEDKNSGYSGMEALDVIDDDPETEEAMDAQDCFDEQSCIDEMCEDAYDAEYKGKKVTLNKPFKTPGESKKYAVYVENKSGNVQIVRFGDPNMEIRRDNPQARKNFRSRHDCANKNDKTKPGYWACKFWSTKSVSELLNG
jgi:phage-related protein (TIGR01555 family)